MTGTDEDIDITDWSIDEIEAWESKYQRFATMARADAAADKWEKENITPKLKADSEYWHKYYDEEYKLEQD